MRSLTHAVVPFAEASVRISRAVVVYADPVPRDSLGRLDLAELLAAVEEYTAGRRRGGAVELPAYRPRRVGGRVPDRRFQRSCAGPAGSRPMAGHEQRRGRARPGPRDAAERVPLGTPSRAARCCDRPSKSSATARPESRVFAPGDEPGEAIGVLELRLPAEPGPATLEQVALAATALAYVVIANRRFTDLFTWGQRSVSLSLAAEIQHRLLPDASTCEAGQFTLAAWLEPAGEVADGDTFDFSLERDTLHVSMTDAVGHSMEAAILASNTGPWLGSVQVLLRQAPPTSGGCCRTHRHRHPDEGRPPHAVRLVQRRARPGIVELSTLGGGHEQDRSRRRDACEAVRATRTRGSLRSERAHDRPFRALG